DVLERTPADNADTDTDTLTPVADLSIAKTDGVTGAVPGDTVTSSIVVTNAGPSDVVGATVAAVLPAAIVSATWSCAGPAGTACTAAGTGDIADTVDLPAGTSITYTVAATIDASAIG